MIVLIGFMGAGKSTVGRLLAARLGLGFVDADAVIEAEQELRIPAIFEGYGEAGFRRIEAKTIAKLLTGPEVVLSLGGGAPASAEVRAALAGHQVVLLDIEFEEACRRVGGDSSRPMLTRPDLPEIYANRQKTYREAASVVVPAGGRKPDEVAAAVLDALSAGSGS